MITSPHFNTDHATRTRKQARAYLAWVTHTLPRIERENAEREARAALLRESMGDVEMPANASDAGRSHDTPRRRATPVAKQDGSADGHAPVAYAVTRRGAGEWRVRLSREAKVTRTTPLTPAEVQAKRDAAAADAIRERVAVLSAHVQACADYYADAIADAHAPRNRWIWRTPADADGKQSIMRTLRDFLSQRDAILSDWTDAYAACDSIDLTARGQAVVAHRAGRSAYEKTRRRERRASESAEDRASRLAKQREATRRSRERKRAAAAQR